MSKPLCEALVIAEDAIFRIYHLLGKEAICVASTDR